MSENNKIFELAQRIYALDEKVYNTSGSELGRLYTGKEEDDINRLILLLTEKPHSHEMRSDLALISNMARTISDGEKKKELMREYSAILKEINSLDAKKNPDILDPHFLELNESALKAKENENEHLIICINRTEGSAGTEIGFALADKLHINYYDSEVLSDLIERQSSDTAENYSSVKVSLKNHPLLKSKKVQQLSKNHGLPKRDAEFFNASALIKEVAKTEDFVIVGRCADVILQNNHIPYTSVFITAPVLKRTKRIMDYYGLNFKDASKRVVKHDNYRSQYYHYYTGRIWGHSTNYDLCINSARYGIDEAVHLILRVIGRENN